MNPTPIRPLRQHTTLPASLLALLLSTTVVLGACGGGEVAEPAANLATARNVDAPVQGLAESPAAQRVEDEPPPASFVQER